MSETIRALIAIAVLSGSALAVFVWRLGRLDPAEPERLIGELRFSQWMALALAAVGGAWLGVAAVRAPAGYGAVEVTLALTTILFAGWTLQRETRQSLLLLCAAFVEAFWSPLTDVPPALKYGVGIFLWAAVIVYFVAMGRGRAA